MAHPPFSRRAFVLASAAALAAPRALAQSGFSSFADIENFWGGRVGVCALDTGSGTRLTHRSDERFAMCSSFKWILAANALARVDATDIALGQPLQYSKSDLIDYSPVTAEHVDDGQMMLQDLCAAMVEVSDNAAANIVLKRLGGPGDITGFVRELGDRITRLDRYEPDLNTNLPDDPRDTTTPEAMIGLMNRILLGDALSAESKAKLLYWMYNGKTGLTRLRAALPDGWTAADKTGTGQNGAAVDNAVFWPPDRAPILIAAYLSGSEAPVMSLNAALAEIGRIVVRSFA